MFKKYDIAIVNCYDQERRRMFTHKETLQGVTQLMEIFIKVEGKREMHADGFVVTLNCNIAAGVQSPHADQKEELRSTFLRLGKSFCMFPTRAINHSTVIPITYNFPIAKHSQLIYFSYKGHADKKRTFSLIIW